ncbi:MAG: DUF2791 family P-loop domain-containing protein [Bryobacterales bacterium]|nr:DUF2791 family P-loop domain-containing protein [Bryobacterales bacterium]
MSATMQPGAWLRFMEIEYLKTYIRNGGGSIKFAVAHEDRAAQFVSDGLAEAGERLGFINLKIDAAGTKIHLMEEIFFRAAAQVPWRTVCRQIIRAITIQAGYKWPDILADEDETPLGEQIAFANGIESPMVLMELKRLIYKGVRKDPKLAKDFRIALTRLCFAELSGGPDGAQTVQTLTDWLTGVNRTISAVKPYEVFRKINRATARYFFESMTHLVRLAGYAGVLLVLDIAQVMAPRDPGDPGIYYTKAAVLDAYEVLREFIDGAHRLSGFFMAVLPGAAFLEDHARGLFAYDALRFRVFDEVRDVRLVNPMGALVRLGADNGGRDAN